MAIDSGFSIQKPQKGSTAKMDDDIYEVRIDDITLDKNKNFKTAVEEDVLRFWFVVTEEGQFKGLKLRSPAVRPIMWGGGAGAASPSTLYKIYCAAAGAGSLGKEEADAVSATDINSLIGRSLRIMVKSTEKGGVWYNNIVDYMPLKRSVAAAPDPSLGEVNVDEIPF